MSELLHATDYVLFCGDKKLGTLKEIVPDWTMIAHAKKEAPAIGCFAQLTGHTCVFKAPEGLVYYSF